MLPEEILWVIALDSIPVYHAMVMAIPQLARKITLGTQCNHKIHFGYNVKVENRNYISWRLNGKQHRTDGPAVECVNGDKKWYQDDKLHRTDGPAIEHADGGKEWYQDGKRHRTDGPAIEYANGHKQYWFNGSIHRIDGPAIECVNGDKFYAIYGVQYSLQAYNSTVWIFL